MHCTVNIFTVTDYAVKCGSIMNVLVKCIVYFTPVQCFEHHGACSVRYTNAKITFISPILIARLMRDIPSRKHRDSDREKKAALLRVRYN